MMRNETILKKARNVFLKNKYVSQQMEEQKIKIEDLIFKWKSGQVVFSNETGVEFTHLYYSTELIFGLNEQLEKAGLFIEPYDSGTFHITELC